jgi:hypothetical protein
MPQPKAIHKVKTQQRLGYPGWTKNGRPFVPLAATSPSFGTYSSSRALQPQSSSPSRPMHPKTSATSKSTPKSADDTRPISKRAQKQHDRLAGEGGAFTAANIASHNERHGPNWTVAQVQAVWADLDASLSQDRWQLFLGRQAFRDYLLSIGLTELARNLQNCSSCVERGKTARDASMEYATRRFSSAATSSAAQSSAAQSPKPNPRTLGKTSSPTTPEEPSAASVEHQPKVRSTKPSQSLTLSSPVSGAAATPKPTSVLQHLAAKQKPPVPIFQPTPSTVLPTPVAISPPPPPTLEDQPKAEFELESEDEAVTAGLDDYPLRFSHIYLIKYTYIYIYIFICIVTSQLD